MKKILFILLALCGGAFAQVTLSSPATGSMNEPTTLTLSWNSGGSYYIVEVSTSDQFLTTVIYQTNVTGTSLKISGLSYNTGYAWRVRYGSLTWSTATIWAFVTGAAPTPTLTSPVNGSSSPVPITLSWSNSLPGGTSQLQIAVDSLFDSTASIHPLTYTTQNTSYTISLGTTTGWYYWRVRDSVNVWSNWSSKWKFNITSTSAVLPTKAVPRVLECNPVSLNIKNNAIILRKGARIFNLTGKCLISK